MSFLKHYKETARKEMNSSRGDVTIPPPSTAMALVQDEWRHLQLFCLCEGRCVLDPDLAAPGCRPPASRATRPFVGQRKTTQQVDQKPF
jgi:hypothetical protein